MLLSQLQPITSDVLKDIYIFFFNLKIESHKLQLNSTISFVKPTFWQLLDIWGGHFYQTSQVLDSCQQNIVLWNIPFQLGESFILIKWIPYLYCFCNILHYYNEVPKQDNNT